MNKKLLVLLPLLALLGQGCVSPVVQNNPTVEPLPDDAPICEAPPTQVYFHAKATFTAAELVQINRDIVQPIKDYYLDENTTGYAVAIIIKKQQTDLIVETIINQTGTDDPAYEGVLLRRLSTGLYEAWTPVDAGPGYAG